MRKLAVVPVALALVGCTINAVAPINANTQVQANTQVDQRQGAFSAGSGPVQMGQANQVPLLVSSPAPNQPMPTISNTGPHSSSPSVAPSHWSDELYFVGVKKLQTPYVVNVVDFNHVRVATGTSVAWTDDAGKTWSQQDMVSSDQIRCMYWLNEKQGWAGAGVGTLLKLTKDGNNITVDPIDCGPDVASSVVFIDDKVGFVSSGTWSPVRITRDGGVTWEVSFSPGDPTEFIKQGEEVLAVNGQPTYDFTRWDLNAPVFRYNNGGFETRHLTGSNGVWLPSRAENRIYFAGMYKDVSHPFWAWTDDLKTFTKVGEALRTPKGFVRDQVIRMYAITDNQVVAQLREGRYMFSDDGAKNWTEPKKFGLEFSNMVPLGGTKMWAWASDTLYRSGI